MVGLAQLVNESLARHGVDTQLDPQRLQWSDWFRCESCFSFLRVSDSGGIFALAEEIVGPGDAHAATGKRMLAIYRVAETEHLGLTMGRLFLPRGSEVRRLATGRCFARYSVVEDAAQRSAACAALQQWMASSADTALGVSAPSEAAAIARSSNKEAQIGPRSPFPSGF